MRRRSEIRELLATSAPVTARQAPSAFGGSDASRGCAARTLNELGIGFVPVRPLGKGFLTGTCATVTPRSLAGYWITLD